MRAPRASPGGRLDAQRLRTYFRTGPYCGFRYLSKKSVTVFHVGVNGTGFVKAQPAEDVERMVAASRTASTVRNAFQGPWPPLGRLMKTASLHALFSAMY